MTPTSTPITLPHDLRPTDGRFGSGPARVPQQAVDRLAAAAPSLLGTSHRRPPVKALVRRIRDGLSALFRLPDGYQVALGTGGATLFWEIAAFSLIRRRSAHAVFGEFSGKFADVVTAVPFLQCDVVEAPPGDHPELVGGEGVDAYALTHCETSTGVAMPIRRPAGEGLVLVDATSAAGGMLFDPAEADAYYFSPQKGLASEGGLWVALLSAAAVERAAEITGSGRHVPPMLDLHRAVENSQQDQTYNTPAIATLFLMAEQVDRLNEAGGLEAAVRGCGAKSQLVYDWADRSAYAAPFVSDPAKRSPVVCTIDLDEAVTAGDVCAALRANGIVDIEAYRKLGRNQLRIAVFPAIDQGDVERLLASIDYVVEQLV